MLPGFDATPLRREFKRLMLRSFAALSAVEKVALRLLIGAAGSGPNNDITSLTGLTSAVYATGQCRLTKSGANLILLPFGGNALSVAGRSCTVPDAGITLAPTGLSATTLYYIYAVATAGVISSLEASTTVPVADTTAGNKGVMIKTGDATRSLVGMAYVKTAATFVDSTSQRFVLSHYNRRSIAVETAFTGIRTTTSGTYSEINGEIRNEYITWADEAVDIMLCAQAYNLTGATIVYTGLGIDSATTAYREVQYTQQPTIGVSGSSVLPRRVTQTEGYHFATLLGRVSGSTGNWLTDTAISTIIKG